MYDLKRLSFELDFQIVHVPEPDEDHYRALLTQYAALCGHPLAGGTDAAALLRRLKRYRGALFGEGDIPKYVDHAIGRAGDGPLTAADFVLFGETDAAEAVQKLDGLIGLREVKQHVLSQFALRSMQQARGRHMVTHNNLAFSGNPGTGKSVVARIYGEILAQAGISNGRFVSAGKSDLVGKYVGHTAPLLRSLFQKADGGVLFIDEAASLLLEDDFSREAVTELVRHMEERPQTTVIFATYPNQMQALLGSDPGFSSRIRKIIPFPDYSSRELLQIFEHMVHDAGFRLDAGAGEAAEQYFTLCKTRKKETFANAREARKLMELAVEKHCLRVYGPSMAGATGDAGQTVQTAPADQTQHLLTAMDVRQAALELLPKEPARRPIGFQVAAETTG